MSETAPSAISADSQRGTAASSDRGATNTAAVGVTASWVRAHAPEVQVGGQE